MADGPKPFIKSRAWIPDSLLPSEDLLSLWRIPLFEDTGCRSCPHLSKRLVTECETCPHFKGILKLYQTREADGVRWYGFPNGNMNRLNDLLGKIEYDDMRPDHKFTVPVRFTMNLYDGSVVNGKKTVDQRDVVDAWKEKGYGIIKCPPRAGKTLMSIAAAVETGRKVMVIAHESRLINQFYEEFCRATNLKELEEQDGKTYIKVLENPDEDLKNPDLQVVLATYQKFIRDNVRGRRTQLLNERFSMVIVDEVHQASSPAYSRFLGNLSVRFKLGLSATPSRKDGLNYVMEQVIGPVIKEAKVVAMPPRIELVETGISLKSNPSQWSYFIQHLTSSKRRIEFIVDEVFRDLAAGRKAIIIPVDNVKPGWAIADAINKANAKREAAGGEIYADRMADFYCRDTKNKGIIDDFNSGKLSVLVAMRSMIKQGLTFEHADMLYMVIPMSPNKDTAVGAPLFRQLSFRVSTPTPTKKDPTLKLFVDDHPLSYMVAASLLRYEIIPGIRSVGGADAPYKMHPDDEKRGLSLMRLGRNYKPLNLEEGERITSAIALERSRSLLEKKKRDRTKKRLKTPEKRSSLGGFFDSGNGKRN